MSMPPLAALGSFIFSPTSGSFEELEQSWDNPRAVLDVIGGPPVKHWMGPGDRIVTISGSIWPEIQLPGLWKIDDLAAVARTGTPVTLLMAHGAYLGLWGIQHITKTDGLLQRFGFPGEINYTITLEGV
ncbi:MAG: phage tail protein [Pseudomonadota bacterium]